jgi:N-acetylglucosamine malate deacetylase 1
MKKILVVSAHPDDEVLGCGGTIARHVKEGSQVYLIILGEGITSRFSKREKGLGSSALKTLRTHISDASKLLGIKRTYTFDLPDNRFDSIDLLDIVKVIENVMNELKPDIIYTHHRNDLNIDHRIAFDATLTACRPIEGASVKEIYSYEVPSSTEWNYPCVFQPNVYIDVSKTIKNKTAAMRAYKSEIRKWPHPRSEKAIIALSQKRGYEIGFDNAEAFELIRSSK